MVKNNYYMVNKNRSFFGEYPTLQEVLEITVLNNRDGICFITNKPIRTEMTFAEVHQKVSKIGSWLMENGIEKGDRVALCGKNSIAWALLYIAVSYAGAVVVPMDCQMETDKLSRLVKFSGARMLFIDSELINGVEDIPDLKVMDLGAVSDLAPSTLKDKVKITCDDVLSMLFTSGTTGNEKCVVLSHANVISDAFMASSDEFLTLGTFDVMFALLPLHHAYCCTAVLVETLLNGNRCLFGQGMVPSKIISDMKEGNVTFMMGIPMLYNKFLSATYRKIRSKGAVTYAMFRTLMWVNGCTRKLFHINNGRVWFKTVLESLGMMDLNVCISGAGPLSPKTFKAYQRLGIDFIQGYGLTETSPILALNPVSAFKVKSVGRIFPEIETRILEPDAFGVGELAVKGPCCTKGYYKDEESSRALFTDDGFLRTGDLGVLDKNGYLYLKGRAKNIIVTEGGKNVFPEEIEEHFQLFPEISQILVRGYVQDKSRMSEEIEAVIYPSPEFFAGRSPDEVRDAVQEIVHSVNAKMISYKKISRISIVDQPMSMTTTKKIQRSKVAEAIGSLIRLI